VNHGRGQEQTDFGRSLLGEKAASDGSRNEHGSQKSRRSRSDRNIKVMPLMERIDGRSEHVKILLRLGGLLISLSLIGDAHNFPVSSQSLFVTPSAGVTFSV
jgi:hypothetical protein